jgi:metal-responsive CopG/Arc/MetJ family transcriptional regulator
LPSEVLQEVEKFIKDNKQFGYSTREEFFREAARWLMNRLKRKHIGLAIAKPEDTTCLSETVSQLEA